MTQSRNPEDAEIKKSENGKTQKASVVTASRPAKGKRRGEENPRPKGFRAWAGLFMAISGLYLAISIALSEVWPFGWAPLVLPGRFLYQVFSWAAWYLPVWCLWAALLIVLPGFYPRATFLLGASSLPFLIVAAFARISTEPGAFFENHPVFAAVGLSSLYAVLGFLFALCWVFLILGLIKIGEKIRGMGAGASAETDTGARGGTMAGKNRDRPRETWRTRYRRWSEDRKLKRSQAEIRLKKSESLTGQTFDINLPDLPPIDGLKTVASPRSASAPPPGVSAAFPSSAGASAPSLAPGLTSQVPATAAVAAGLGAQVFSPATPSQGATVQTPISAPAGAMQKVGSIEFTSVPPQKRSGAPADDAEKQALIQKIMERAKPKPYAVPIDGVLNSYPDGQYWIIDEKTKRNAEVLRDTLAEFNIEAEVTGIRKGPVITMFEILPAHGVKISKITNLSDNIALRLAASSVRIVAPIPGKHAVGIEVPNDRRAIVSLREIIENEQFRTAKMEIPIALGKDIAGEVQFTDLTQAPHLLIAGATGSGKSVCVNAIILSILYRRSPEEVKLMLIDPKIVELKLYNDIPHLLTPVITDSKRAFQALQYCICEMERRYSILDKAGVRDIKSYNKRVKERNLAQEKLPYIVVIIDEFADLMATTGKELESTLARLAAMARAVGIHLVLATQRPSIDVITGLIKANIPSRIAFMVASKFDSRIIIDTVGAEKLLGRGDMLFSGAQDPFPVRMQGAFVSEEEVERAVEYVKTLGEPEYIDDEIFYDEEAEDAEPGLFDDGDGDPLFEKALEIVLQQGKASASFIQRRLKIGYNRAARLVELMEERGIVGPAQGSKPREVLHNPDIGGKPMQSPLQSRHGEEEDDSAGQ